MKDKKFTISERVLKWTKKTKKYNFIIMITITIIAVLLLIFAMTRQTIEPVKGMAKKNDDIQIDLFR